MCTEDEFGVSRVDVLLGHDMERARFWKPEARDAGEWLEIDESLDYENAPVMQALREAKAQGFCRYLGLSSNRSEPLAHVLQRVKLDMCLSAGEYSLMNRRFPRVMLPVIREQGIPNVIGGIVSVGGRGVINAARSSRMRASSSWPGRLVFRSQH